MIRKLRSQIASVLTGIYAASFMLGAVLADIYASSGSRKPDVGAGLVYSMKSVTAFGYASRTQSTAFSILVAISISTLFLFVVFVPKDFKSYLRSTPQWYIYPGLKIIFLCSAATFLMGAYFFGTSVVDYFISHDWCLSHHELQ